MGLGEGSTLFFCMWVSSFLSTIYWKDCIFPTELSWHPCQKLLDHISEDFFPRFYSIPLVSMFVLCTSPEFGYCSFTVCFEIRSFGSFQLYFSFSDFLYFYKCPLRFHMNFRMHFSIFWKVSLALIGLHWI